MDGPTIPAAFSLPPAHGKRTAPCGQVCLDETVPCRCRAEVKAGDGHHDCPGGGWFGFWICADCGHCSRHHNQWWDLPDSDCYPGGAGGVGCDTVGCDCDDSGHPSEAIPQPEGTR